MYVKLLLVVIAVVLPGSLGQEEVPGKLLSTPMFAFFADAPVTCDGVRVYSECKDCSTVLNCIGAVTDPRDCSSFSPDKPFCNNGTCSADRPTSNVCPAKTITCSSEGFYPDPYNCEIYHYCEKAAEASSIYECPPNYVYNAETTLCKQKKLASDCVTVKCDSKTFLAAYGTSKTYYAYCKYTNGVLDPTMLKCPENSKFDGTTCVFSCPKEGNFAHPSPSKFYQCYYSGTALISKEVACATGKIFDQTKGVCLTAPAPPKTGEPSTQ